MGRLYIASQYIVVFYFILVALAVFYISNQSGNVALFFVRENNVEFLNKSTKLGSSEPTDSLPICHPHVSCKGHLNRKFSEKTLTCYIQIKTI